MRRCVLVLVMLLLGACSDPGPAAEPDVPGTGASAGIHDSSTTTAATSPSEEPTVAPTVTSAATTTAPLTSITAASTTTTSEAMFGFPPVLVAGPGGVEIVAGGGSRLLWEGPALAAHPDGAGGAVIWVEGGSSFEWDEELRRYRVDPADAVELLRVDASGAATDLLSAEPEAIHGLIEVARVAGRPTAVIWRAVPGPAFPGGSDIDWRVVSESILSHLVHVDLVTGAETTYGLVASYESDARIASFGGESVAICIGAYGGGMSPLRSAPLGALPRLDPGSLGDPSAPWLEQACDAGSCAPVASELRCVESEGCWVEVRKPKVSPDGSAVAYVEVAYGPEGLGRPEVAVAELPAGVEIWRVQIGGTDPNANVWPIALDFDGERVLVSFSGEGASPDGLAVLVDGSGELGRVPVNGRAVLWAAPTG